MDDGYPLLNYDDEENDHYFNIFASLKSYVGWLIDNARFQISISVRFS